MEVKVHGKILQFNEDLETGMMTAPFALSEWGKFKSENSRRGLEGEHVQFILWPEDIGAPGILQKSIFYSRIIEWFLDEQKKIKASTLDALTKYIDLLRHDYGIDDEDLNAFSSRTQLTNMVDISYVYFYSRLKARKPIFAFEMECNWDPEHGCGVLFNGSNVVDVGGSDTAQMGNEI